MTHPIPLIAPTVEATESLSLVSNAPTVEAEASSKTAKAPKQVRRSRDPLPLNRVGGVALEAFNEAVRCWPIEISGWNSRTHQMETRKIPLGNTAMAQRNFLELLEGGHATPQQLYACAWCASTQWKKESYIWVPHLSTFYGPEKEMWASWLDQANDMLEKL